MRRVSTIAVSIFRTYSSCSITLSVLSILITFLPGIGGNGTTTMSPTRTTTTTTMSPSSGSIRLVGSNHISQGVVEVLINGSWGAICANNIFEGEGGNGDTFAEVACRQLGYNKTDGTDSKAVKRGESAYEVPDYLNWFYEDLRCQGSEDRLQDCNYLTQYDNTGCPSAFASSPEFEKEVGDVLPTAGVASVKCYDGDWAQIENDATLYFLLCSIVILLVIGLLFFFGIRYYRQGRAERQRLAESGIGVTHHTPHPGFTQIGYMEPHDGL